ncbi:MAG: polysaccharide pyruvyl transferase family protein [Sedimentisphaerales bacterium]|nr:polysaccharide pyruvyl transferase family protein [Sedimentisphaerales bacterium]
MGERKKTMNSQSPLFILAGNAGYYNRGSEAIAIGTMHILRKHFTDPRFLTVSHFKKKEQFKEQCFRETDPKILHRKMHTGAQKFTFPWFLVKTLRKVCPPAVKHVVYKDLKKYLDEAVAVLAVGGDNYSLDYGRVPKTCTDLDDLVVAAGKPLIIWGASIGPFDRNPEYEQYMANHLKKVHILARETSTIQYLSNLGLVKNVHRVADPAFVVEAIRPSCDRYELEDDRMAIGLNFSPLMAEYVTAGDMEKWRETTAAIITSIAQETKSRIYLIPHVTGIASNDDYEFMKKAMLLISEYKDQINLIKPVLNSPETKWVISKMAVFIGARTHSAIASLSSGVPTLSLGYSMKALGLNKDIFGNSEFCIMPKEISVEVVVEKLKYIMQNSDRVKTILKNKIPEMKDLAMRAGSILKEILAS